MFFFLINSIKDCIGLKQKLLTIVCLGSERLSTLALLIKVAVDLVNGWKSRRGRIFIPNGGKGG